jgi:hypothetical protein
LAERLARLPPARFAPNVNEPGIRRGRRGPAPNRRCRRITPRAAALANDLEAAPLGGVASQAAAFRPPSSS